MFVFFFRHDLTNDFGEPNLVQSNLDRTNVGIDEVHKYFMFRDEGKLSVLFGWKYFQKQLSAETGRRDLWLLDLVVVFVG